MNPVLYPITRRRHNLLQCKALTFGLTASVRLSSLVPSSLSCLPSLVLRSLGICCHAVSYHLAVRTVGPFSYDLFGGIATCNPVLQRRTVRLCRLAGGSNALSQTGKTGYETGAHNSVFRFYPRVFLSHLSAFYRISCFQSVSKGARFASGH